MPVGQREIFSSIWWPERILHAVLTQSPVFPFDRTSFLNHPRRKETHGKHIEYVKEAMETAHGC